MPLVPPVTSAVAPVKSKWTRLVMTVPQFVCAAMRLPEVGAVSQQHLVCGDQHLCGLHIVGFGVVHHVGESNRPYGFARVQQQSGAFENRGRAGDFQQVDSGAAGRFGVQLRRGLMVKPARIVLPDCRMFQRTMP